MRRVLVKGAASAALLVGLLVCRPAAADRTVLYDRQAPIWYRFEVEPHLVLGTAPPGPGYGSGGGIGVRGTFVLSQDGFIPGVNDSLALGVGLDYSHYDAALSFQGARDQCLHFEPGPNGTSICTQVTSNGGTYSYLFVPVVLQWNFWFTQRFSAFGEPGVDLYLLANHGVSIGPAVYVGGRVQVTDRITLTLRLGYPTVSFGVSFLM
jgi:hypothetical protein